MIRSIVFAAVFALSLPASAQSAKDFAEANARTDLQPKDKVTSAYAHSWEAFNNEHHLDERDGCYDKGKGALIQILEIDASGKVVGYFADKHDGRARCWRLTYPSVVFPQPPFAPFYYRMEMQ
jgi:hypothetical protein